MHDFKHKEETEKRLRKSIFLLVEQATFIKVLATFDGGYCSDTISDKFIGRYGNHYNIHKPKNPPFKNYHTVFDDIWIFGEILKEKAMELLDEYDWQINEDEDHYCDAVSSYDRAVQSGFL